jgi:hypothetical protein
MTDRLDLATAIEAAGIERKAAENIAGLIFDAIRENVATKADLSEMQARLDHRIDQLDHRIDLLDRRIDLVKYQLGAIITTVAGLLFAALHYWPPHG